ncbi:MAG: dienelactone hydrolase family protein [Ekhidna sp.]|uniref:alpha/beta hydrolase family protein n=1 Tax=Ekhidna sp. TaxID=2608089 RepID=UPI0032EBE1A8
MELFLNDKLGKISAEETSAPRPLAILIMAHGAGAGMHHPFMHSLAGKIADLGVTTIRFNFPYMEEGRRSPGSPKTNIKTWELIVEHIKAQYPGMPVFISGKSYGGRMASHLLAEVDVDVKGVIYYGFPLHAPGRDSKDRADHLGKIRQPQLFLQGSRDKLANLELIKEVQANLPKSSMEVIDGADHSFNVPKKSGMSKEDVMTFLAKKSVEWMKGCF